MAQHGLAVQTGPYIEVRDAPFPGVLHSPLGEPLLALFRLVGGKLSLLGQEVSILFGRRRSAYSLAAVDGLWPKVQPGAMHGRDTVSPLTGLCERISRSRHESSRHRPPPETRAFISATVVGLSATGTWRSAASCVHPHQPELARCSPWRRAETSSVKYGGRPKCRAVGRPGTGKASTCPRRPPRPCS
eukprot:5938348-Prymnesium_polylepis.1